LREDGPASHAAKAKTPTMGGVCFIVATALGCLTFDYSSWRDEMAPPLVFGLVFALALACGWLGFSDDFAKVKGQGNKGISAALRMNVEAMLGGFFGLAMVLLHYRPAQGIIVPRELASALGSVGISSSHLIGAPLSNWAFHLTEVTLPGIVIVILSIFLVTATTNSVNLHDGMDGLAAGTSMLVLLSIAIMTYWTWGLAFLALAAAGSLFGFLFFNRHPAKIFMGDTGSLFIGGLIAGLVIASGLVLWFIPLSAIYIAESVSVMAQVVYFKLTKPYEPPTPMSAPALFWHKLTKRLPGDGKRLFLMAPLHHHFEALLIDRGMDKDRVEWLVVGGFWLVQLLLCAFTLATFFAF
jgi:phospho-N-acetylmuramoyl-pentapeptide-transferase